MDNDFDPLETAEVCAESTEQELNRDLEDIIMAYGTRAFTQAVMRSTAGHTVERLNGGINQMKALVWVLSEIIHADKPRLVAECAALATGMFSGQPQTMTAIARKHGMSKANVSRRVLEISDRLGMQPSTNMKPKATRLEYTRTNGATRKTIEQPTKEPK